mmetsp:Transcript_27079/g.82099  ORF Transcript_27079/g.82099 Transcript_27079/m.82099 type:complete len:227 (+) Transcript_27079:203-883(+)
MRGPGRRQWRAESTQASTPNARAGAATPSSSPAAKGAPQTTPATWPASERGIDSTDATSWRPRAYTSGPALNARGPQRTVEKHQSATGQNCGAASAASTIHANSTPEKPRCQAPTAPPACRVRLAATSPTNTTSAAVLHKSAAEPCLRSKAPPNEYAVDRLNTKCVASTCARFDVRSRQYWRPSMDSADAPTVSPVQRFTRMTAKKAKRPRRSANVAGVSDMSAAA